MFHTAWRVAGAIGLWDQGQGPEPTGLRGHAGVLARGQADGSSGRISPTAARPGFRTWRCRWEENRSVRPHGSAPGVHHGDAQRRGGARRKGSRGT